MIPKTNIANNHNSIKQRMLIPAHIILKYLITDDDETHTLITCKNTEYDFVTTDKELYEALGSITPYDSFKLNRLVKLLEVIDIVSTKSSGKDKGILKQERVEELRRLALKNQEG